MSLKRQDIIQGLHSALDTLDETCSTQALDEIGKYNLKSAKVGIRLLLIQLENQELDEVMRWKVRSHRRLPPSQRSY